MITHIFRKKQDSSLQFCSCSLTDNGIANPQKGEKFLTRPQTESSTGNIQVNRPKATGLKKEKQIKISLRGKQRKHENTQISTPVVEIGSRPKLKMEKQASLAFKISEPIVRSPYQQTQFFDKNIYQRQAFILAKQIHPRQGLQQIKIDNNLQRYEKPFTQKSTHLSNLTQAKNSIQLGPAQISTKFLYNTFISAIQQKEVMEANCLPRSKSFSINHMRLNGNPQNTSFIVEENQNQTSTHYLSNEESSHKSLEMQLKLSDLIFKSAESIQQAQNDQHSELASDHSQLSHRDINDNSWSHSLNQIFVKKMRRLSHNPPA